MHIAILGGSFDPVHIGHLHTCEQVLLELGYDRVLLVPAYQSPLRSGSHFASPEQRLEMLTRAIKGNARLQVETWELEQKRLSYTIDTIRYLIRRCNPNDNLIERFGLIIGSDQIEQFAQWRDSEQLLELVDLIVFGRDHQKPKNIPAAVPYIDTLPLIMSSSLIRQRIAQGLAFRYLVPEAVYNYINERRLYSDESVSNTYRNEA